MKVGSGPNQRLNRKTPFESSILYLLIFGFHDMICLRKQYHSLKQSNPFWFSPLSNIFSNQKGSWLWLLFSFLIVSDTRWWFPIFFIVLYLSPLFGEDEPILTFPVFQMGWNLKPPTIGYYVLFYQGGRFPPPQCFHTANLFPHRVVSALPKRSRNVFPRRQATDETGATGQSDEMMGCFTHRVGYVQAAS